VARVVLDSSVLIALLSPTDQHHQSVRKALTAKHQYLISALTLTETLIAPNRISAETGQQIFMAIKKAVHEVIDIDSEVAVLAAQIRASSNLTLPDALISATATTSKSQLWTCDKALGRIHRGIVNILTKD
jgi:predicted nucleic acid-binding protein